MGSPSHNYVSTPSPPIGKDHNNLHEAEHSQFFCVLLVLRID